MSEDHQHAYYQAGALIYAAKQGLGGGNADYGTTGSWRDIQNAAGGTMTFSYTPPVDSWMVLELLSRFQTNTAGRSIAMHIWDGSAEVAYGVWSFVRTNFPHTAMLVGMKELTAGVTYDFQARYRLPADEAQTIYTIVGTNAIQFNYRVYRKP